MDNEVNKYSEMRSTSRILPTKVNKNPIESIEAKKNVKLYSKLSS